jgi:hypothetical protein
MVPDMARFTATTQTRPGRAGGIAVRLPFDPDEEWGPRDAHHVTGVVQGQCVRGQLRAVDGVSYLELGPAWCRDSGATPGMTVEIELVPEGPQYAAMAPDLVAAFDAEPAARRFFESLPTFYRKNFMRPIDQAKRPATRARKIAEMMSALREGRRER